MKDALNNILEDLNTNIEDFQAHSGQKTNKRRIRKNNKFINKIDSGEKQFIESKLDKKMLDKKTKKKEFEPISNTPKDEKIRKNPYDNVKTRKRKLLAITSETRLTKNYQVFILRFQQTKLRR